MKRKISNSTEAFSLTTTCFPFTPDSLWKDFSKTLWCTASRLATGQRCAPYVVARTNTKPRAVASRLNWQQKNLLCSLEYKAEGLSNHLIGFFSPLQKPSLGSLPDGYLR